MTIYILGTIDITCV